MIMPYPMSNEVNKEETLIKPVADTLAQNLGKEVYVRGHTTCDGFCMVGSQWANLYEGSDIPLSNIHTRNGGDYVAVVFKGNRTPVMVDPQQVLGIWPGDIKHLSVSHFYQ
jgi:hypothetical protein